MKLYLTIGPTPIEDCTIPTVLTQVFGISELGKPVTPVEFICVVMKTFTESMTLHDVRLYDIGLWYAMFFSVSCCCCMTDFK